MGEFAVERGTLRSFHTQSLQQAINQIETLRHSLKDGDVPDGAYSRTDAGAVAQQGHAQNLEGLDKLFGDLHTVLTDFAERVDRNLSNYETGEDATGQSARSVKI
jgi:hypothetical protein